MKKLSRNDRCTCGSGKKYKQCCMAADAAAHAAVENQQQTLQSQLASWMEQGMTLHRSGQLDAARKFYQQILALQPDHADALHLFGVIAHQ